ncbi:hypothetical protein [uncultured Gammaproteobacteria bacterium]|nr:hypothetical protein [uncultured Gammaproteobacteria bacterium]
MMCWETNTAALFTCSVSVAGCLGYDVLDINDIFFSPTPKFQLLVV